MFKQVVDIAWDNMTFIDGMILAIGFIALVLIVILAGIKAAAQKNYPEGRVLEICLHFSSLYRCLIDICPLMGTLGTVVSLIYSASNPSELESSFLFALTSTLWGIIMAVICKVVESITRVDSYFGMLEEMEK